MAEWISAETLADWMASPRPLTVIDVRLGKVGTLAEAIHIPVTDLEDEPRVFPQDHDLVVFCQFGGRGSEYAAEVLEEQGYHSVYMLTGGLDAYLALTPRTVSEGIERPEVSS
jgi:rhodanese-related sulfurtransferase